MGVLLLKTVRHSRGGARYIPYLKAKVDVLPLVRAATRAYTSVNAQALLVVCRFLPKNLGIIGYARSKLNIDDLRATVAKHLKGTTEEVSQFLGLISYLPGAYDCADGFQVDQRFFLHACLIAGLQATFAAGWKGVTW